MNVALYSATTVLLLGLTALRAQGQSHDVLRPIRGEESPGQLVAVAADGTVSWKLLSGDKIQRSLGDLQSITLKKRPGAPVPKQGFVQLRSGMRIPATVRECAGRKITIDSPLTDGRTTISLSHIHAIRFSKLEAEKDGGFRKYLAAPKEDVDLIYFRTSSKIIQRSVRIQSLDGDEISYEARGEMRTRAIKGLYGLVLARSSGFPPDPLPRPRVVLETEDGSKIRAKMVKLDGAIAEVTLAEGVSLRVQRQYLRKITVESDRLVFLSDLKPSKVEQTPAFRSKKPWLVNRSPAGEGIHIGGINPRKAANGLVLIPRTKLTFDIGGKFDFFEATLCIDNRSTGPAHAVFRVLDGDKVLYESKPLTLQSEPLAIKVPVSKVKTLSLEADFGKNFDFGDHCAFAEARVIKGS